MSDLPTLPPPGGTGDNDNPLPDLTAAPPATPGVPPVPPPPGSYSQAQPPAPGAPQFGAPPPPDQPQYGAPQPPTQPQYGVPQPQYGVPQQQYGTPQYGVPQPQFGTPQYGAPQPQFGAPQPPGGFQPPAAPYQYRAGLPSSAALATPGKRILGYLLDVVILVVIIGVSWIPFVLLAASSSTTTYDEYGYRTSQMSSGATIAMVIALVITVVVPIAYHIAMVALKGQTLGAMAVKVKVVRLSDGETPGWGPATMRWLPNLVSLVPYCGSCMSFGLLIWALINLFNNERRQTPYDLAAKTVVIDVS